eukprot:gnl/MRDRNA2_/MRDRNA2_68072_c0_seq2.p1 gnl/MRDRNA2_/MRDRNA2_68072_c0~~gnl/MRDRNA2_/MRDRNA2_68072_c0_seq2.p1  ORF type:complete len:194 (+),score=35.10 gnl/MRDRNA2_/MRDRNA2_68072_c0_seq2:101-682(+)
MQVAVLLWLCAASFLERVSTSNVTSTPPPHFPVSDKEAPEGEGWGVEEHRGVLNPQTCTHGFSKPTGRLWKKLGNQVPAGSSARKTNSAWQSTLAVSQAAKDPILKSAFSDTEQNLAVSQDTSREALGTVSEGIYASKDASREAFGKVSEGILVSVSSHRHLPSTQQLPVLHEMSNSTPLEKLYNRWQKLRES